MNTRASSWPLTVSLLLVRFPISLLSSLIVHRQGLPSAVNFASGQDPTTKTFGNTDSLVTLTLEDDPAEQVAKVRVPRPIRLNLSTGRCHREGRGGTTSRQAVMAWTD